MEFKVGDEVILFQDTKSTAPRRCIGEKFILVRIVGANLFLAKLSKYENWYLNIEDIRKITKLEKALK
jgi:hypothetical protein